EVPNILPQGTAYKYDQLNRILEEQAYTNLSIFSNSWDAGSTYANRYHNVFSYDANGNILTQERADASGLSFDQLTYNYRTDGLGNKYQNRLYQVQDAASNSDATDDLDDQDQSTPIGVGHAYDNANANTANNYQYDEIGNLVKDQQEEIDNITWTVYGKIKSITRASGSTKSDLEFNYDASGNRISKIEKPRPGGSPSSSSDWITTYYARDAQGNIMTTYKLAPVSLATSFKVTERNIFGINRLGIEKTEIELTPPIPATPSPFVRTLGNKQYEASNHLGNVLVVFTDKKYPRDDDADGIIDYFQPEVIASNDYYAFGAPMDGRTFSSNKYRFGFNGQEKDDEINGDGNVTTAEFWEYDARLGRRWNIDPIIKPSESPYCTFSDNPIYYSDPNGADPKGGDDQTTDKNNPALSKAPPQDPTTGSIWNYQNGDHSTQFIFNEKGEWVPNGQMSGSLKTVEVSADKPLTKWQKFKNFFDVGVIIYGGGPDERPIRNAVGSLPKNLLEISADLWKFFNREYASKPNPFSKSFPSKDIYTQPAEPEYPGQTNKYSEEKPEENKKFGLSTELDKDTAESIATQQQQQQNSAMKYVWPDSTIGVVLPDGTDSMSYFLHNGTQLIKDAKGVFHKKK
ncbi:MAG: hypothetical protein JWQ66_3144, partial [Mucilaginibacter sp.]|nr:hypothetical protein [Mucilaginibacter sp.]